MKHRIFLWLTAAITAALTGCATQLPMALSDNSAPKADKVTLLMSATIDNRYKASFQPELLVVNVEKGGAKEKADRFNFQPDDKARRPSEGKNAPNSYLLSYELAPGDYVMPAMLSMVRSFPFIGSFQTVLMQDLSFPKAGVYYIGHVQAVVRERKDDEERAGPVIPLIDQAVVGASGGTFDVTISDQWAVDEARFKTAYPSLAKIGIEKKLLAPHDQAKVKSRWEALKQ
jgi:hypothetical protein